MADEEERPLPSPPSAPTSVARPVRIERTTSGFVDLRSIQLSYGRLAGDTYKGRSRHSVPFWRPGADSNRIPNLRKVRAESVCQGIDGAFVGSRTLTRDLEGRSQVPPGRRHGDGGGCRTLEHGFAIRGAQPGRPVISVATFSQAWAVKTRTRPSSAWLWASPLWSGLPTRTVEVGTRKVSTGYESVTDGTLANLRAGGGD